MILKITAQVIGNIVIAKPIEVRKRANTICLYRDETTKELMISISKHLKSPELSIPLYEVENGTPKITIQHSEEEDEMLQLIKHIESFGGFDKHISKILWEYSKYEWIKESGDTIISPLSSVHRRKDENMGKPSLITDRWLQDTVIYSDMMKDLYIPFSFFREGSNYFNEEKYVMAFASYYWMLEYFFVSAQGYGISNKAHKDYLCLNTCLRATLVDIKDFNDENFDWLQTELKKRHKKYDEEGLLYVINQCRNELLHTPKKNAEKRAFNEYKYRSLAFVAMTLCRNVQIKMRLLPFVQRENIEDFLSHTPQERKINN